MKIDLQGKTAVVTGAGGDLGAGIVQSLVDCGANVAATDLNLETAEKNASGIIKKDDQVVKPYKMDVSNEEEIGEVFSKIHSEFSSIDILVCAAGFASEGPNYYETSVEVARKITDINLHGTGMCIKKALDYMIPQNYGRIITISSIAGRDGTAALANYSISKAAIIALTQSVARAHAKQGINVNCVCPGYIYSDMWKKGVKKFSKRLNISEEKTWKVLALDKMATGRAQKPEDIGNAVAFLVSDLAKEITGQSLNVCGGAKFN